MVGKGKSSARAAQVARWFGIDHQPQTDRPDPEPPPDVPLRAGQLILLTGPSGAGKSTLLRRLRRKHHQRTRWLDLQRIRLPGAPVIDVMTDAQGGGADEPAILTALDALSRVGLGEVWTYLRTPAQLSEGQRFRLRLAVALAQQLPPRPVLRERAGVRAGVVHNEPSVANPIAPPPLKRRATQSSPAEPLRRPRLRSRRPLTLILAADEFAAPLDRVTATVVARALRRAVTARPDLCAVVATGHDDLRAALDPDLTVHCDFGHVTLQERGQS